MTEVTLDLAPEVEQNLREYAGGEQMTKEEAAAYLLAIGLDEETDEHFSPVGRRGQVRG